MKKIQPIHTSPAKLMDRAQHLEQRLADLEAIQGKQQGAVSALNRLESALKGSKTHKGLAQDQNRLNALVQQLQVQVQNLQAAGTLPKDMDVAISMSNFVRQQVMAETNLDTPLQGGTPSFARQLL